MRNLITSSNTYLPTLPLQMVPIVGTGLKQEKLIVCNTQDARKSPEELMAQFRQEHSPERCERFRVCLWVMPVLKGTEAIVRFIPDWHTKKERFPLVGKTANNLEAIKILVGNKYAGRFMSAYARWELFEDPKANELIDMGRWDQWDLLKGVSKADIDAMPYDRRPNGNWDFWNMLWATGCPSCPNTVSVNYWIYNIDSVACSACGNRPFLSRAIHALTRGKYYKELKGIPGHQKELAERNAHVLQWIAGVRASAPEVRRDVHDPDGTDVHEIVSQSIISTTLTAAHRGTVKRLVELHTPGITFKMFEESCKIVQRALLGKIEFSTEILATAEWVMKISRQLETKQLTTQTT